MNTTEVVKRGLATLVESGSVVEVRALGNGRITSGYFNDLDKMAEAVAELDGHYQGIYFTANPVKEEALARASNRLNEFAKTTTADHDIAHRSLFIVDFDPVRMSGISSTDEEHANALERAQRVRFLLRKAGWPEPVLMDSGNGYYLLYRIDLPADEATRVLLERCLETLAVLFDDSQVAIDQKMANAARIIRVPGTMNRKGDSTDGRPHRVARILEPGSGIVPQTLLEALAAKAPSVLSQESAPPSNGQHSFDLEGFIRKYLRVVKQGPWKGSGRCWVLEECPFNSEHRDRSAFVVQQPNGAIAAGCQHNSCSWGWRELREKFEGPKPEIRFPYEGIAAEDEIQPAKPGRPDERKWPEPMGAAAFRGLAGRFVETVMPHTEADPVAVLAQFLGAFGAAVGKDPHVMVGTVRHTARMFSVLVGHTGAGKGESLFPTLTLFHSDTKKLVPIGKGLSTGEGLIQSVRDAAYEEKDKYGQPLTPPVLLDAGVEDKRLFLVEPEFAKVLRVMTRQGNILSTILRDVWDQDFLAVKTRANPLTATGTHIVLAAHVTPEELKRELTDVDAASGFGNRFAWFAVRRSKDLPEPEPFVGQKVENLRDEIMLTLAQVRTFGQMQRDESASKLWRKIYASLRRERPGLVGALLAKSAPYIVRISLIYALLDGSPMIKLEHLQAAVEVWGYVHQTVEYVFGDATGNPAADALRDNVRRLGGEMDKTAIYGMFGGHIKAAEIEAAVQELVNAGKAELVTRRYTGGRPREVLRVF